MLTNIFRILITIKFLFPITCHANPNKLATEEVKASTYYLGEKKLGKNPQQIVP